jgi:hypothetical protein
MTPENRKSKRLMGVCLLGWILLTGPILSLFNRPTLVFGIPLLFLYVFSVWALLIALIYLVTRSGGSHRRGMRRREGRDA